MAYGLHYELICPYCGETFPVEHGMTSYYHIKGYGDVEYIKEHCVECETSYLRACYDVDVMNMKNNGIPYEEALIRLEKQDTFKNKYFRGKHITEQLLKEQEEQRIKSCNNVYFTDDKKLYIDIDDINKEDLTISSEVFW